ncbi:hypothetical protein [Caproiciproducens galactitolivorans]|jgi:hypothetical protein|uniref:hypothetical protein n=1 Tax=Caproiciproducens galactitolivorans TaxID=642589 RepID=UPI002409F3FE|nr:hypothetical protein [Caproiciproducens galactitolivorans]
MKENQECLTAYAFRGSIIVLRDNHPKVSQAEALFEKYGRMKKRVWLRRVKNLNRHYLETGIWGSYDTAGIVESELDGTPVALFEDTKLKEEPDGICLERHMIVAGKKFAVSSVFPKDASSTPTDKLLSLIDKEQKAERNSF